MSWIGQFDNYYFILGFSLQCDNILSYDKFTNSTVDLVWFINPFRFVFYPLAMYSCAIFLAMNGKFLIFHFFVLVGSQWNWFQTHHWAQYCHTGIQANFEILSKLSKVRCMKSFKKVFYLDLFLWKYVSKC